ncbi:hypothetical protein BJX63DRAFT_428576 [Aspergillus granulosus]|uniref:Bacteriophage T5 Orf172 DNA-binding domain-containing protein n=1 Tax=Aspergillus granulosus TaxID=176169 RepID=A0ABR4HWC8_9EURO
MVAAQTCPLVSGNAVSSADSLLHYPSLPADNEDEQIPAPAPDNNIGRNSVYAPNMIGTNKQDDADPRGDISESARALTEQPKDQPRSPASVTGVMGKMCSNEATDQPVDKIDCLDSKRFRWSLEVSIHELRKVLVSRQYKKKLGHAYVLFDPEGTPYYKIGSSADVTSRWSQHQGKCRLSGWDMQIQPPSEINQCSRLERLAQTELKNLNCVLKCVCDVQHVEYYKGDPATAHDALQRWSDWLVNHEPYVEDNRLGGFWLDRLDIFRSDIPRYFNCGDDQCLGQKGPAVACQRCVRTGWNSWTKPTPSEKLEYACRSHIPYQLVRTITMWLGAGQEDTVRRYVELTGQMRRLIERNFLYLMVIRLFVSVTWPSLVMGGSARFLDTFLLVAVMNIIVHPQYVEILSTDSPGSDETKRSPSRPKSEQPSTPESHPFKSGKPSGRPKKSPSPRKGLKKAVSSDDPFIEAAERTVIPPRPGGKRISSAPSALARPSPSSSHVAQSSRKRRRSNQD